MRQRSHRSHARSAALLVRSVNDRSVVSDRASNFTERGRLWHVDLARLRGGRTQRAVDPAAAEAMLLGERWKQSHWCPRPRSSAEGVQLMALPPRPSDECGHQDAKRRTDACEGDEQPSEAPVDESWRLRC